MIQSPLHAQTAALQAVSGVVAGVELPRRFGDGSPEYRSVREAVGIVDRSDLARFRLHGRDPVRMLHGLITNDLQTAPPGRAVYAAMLTPKGRTIADLRALTLHRADGDEVLVDVAREALDGVRDQLRKYVPPMFARWAEITELTGTIGVYGPRSPALLHQVLEANVSEIVEDGFVEVEWRSADEEEAVRVLVVGTRYAGGEVGYDLIAPVAQLGALWSTLLEQGSALGARPVGYAILEALRVEAGRPRYGAELTAAVIPTEAFESTGQMERAISFSKGCYTGQEVIVRIAHRGHVNRQLRGLLLGEAPLPPIGTALIHPDTGREVGRTATAVHSPGLGQTIALAMVRREMEPGASVKIGATEGVTAEIVTLPFRM